MTRIKCCSHWLQTWVQCFQTLGSVQSAPICNVRQEGVLSFCPLWALARTINSSPQQEGVRSDSFLLPWLGGEKNQIIKCEKQHRKRKKGMDLSARLPSWDYLLRRGVSEHASRGGYIARALQRGEQWRRRPWQKGRHGPSMLHLANTDGCQGLASQACPLQVAPRPSGPTLKGPSRCLRGLSSNDMPHSPLKLLRRAPPPRRWEERCWAGAIVAEG